jgi:type IV secretory pathway VirB4 component
LIDFENVQPKNLEILAKHPFSVFVFVGANQSKLPFELAAAMQRLGDNGSYVRISGNGKNALDFHIAYYIGLLTEKNPQAQFHVISKDKGFDPLIKHLRAQNVDIRRESDLAEIPVLRIKPSTSSDEKIDAIVKNLAARGQSRPRKVKTLENTINTLFTKKLEKPELAALVEELKKRKYIIVKQNDVRYSLPG